MSTPELTIVEASAYLAGIGVNYRPSAIRDMCVSGRLSGAVRRGRFWWIPRAALDELAGSRLSAVSNWFTLEMAASYLETRGIRLSVSALNNRALANHLPGATRRGRFWMIRLEDLQRFADDWENERQRGRERNVRAIRDAWRARRLGVASTARRGGVCRRCEILSSELDDGLCIQCREELAGTYRWYPHEPAVGAAVCGVFHAWGGAE